MSGRPDDGSVRALARGLDVLRLFGTLAPELSQSQVAEALSLPAPTVHRLVGTLEQRGFLIRDRTSRRFRLGLEILRLFVPLMEGMRVPEVAREHVRALASESGETANLGTLDGDEVVYVMGYSGNRLLTVQTSVGLRLPAHCTALGKCLLATVGDELAERFLGPEPYVRRTRRTKGTWGELREDLQRVRADGYALSEEEFEVGLVSLAVPLSVANGRAPLAINVSLPSVRATESERQRLLERLRTTAEAIEMSLAIAA